ncbi:unnamed protein product, partial [Mesorhabditis belari]|uniref:Uncharacterized protein n=1 Tax=Mesorhabditis belari TaxID=2138241 RepID=A0AAF3FLK7_9BILA
MKEIVLEEDEVALSELGFDSFTPTPVVSMINGKVVEKELVLIEMTSKVIQESEDKVRKTSSVKSKSQTLHKGVRDIEIARLSVENEIEKTLPPDPMPTVASPEVKETRTSTVTALKNRFETAPEEALIVNTSVLALATDLEPPGRIIGKIIQEHSRSTSKNRESIGMLLATPAQLQILSTTGDKDIGSLSSINRVFSPIPADPSVIQPIETSRNEYFPVVEILVAPPEPPIDYMNKENAEIENPGNLGKPQEHQLVTNSDFKNNKFSMSKTDSKINPAALYDVGCQAASITLQPSLPELVTTSSVVHDSQISQSNSTRTTIAQSVNTESTLTNTSVGYRSIDPKRLEKMQKADREVQKSFKRSAIRQLNQLEDKYSKEKEAYRINSKKRLKEMEDNKLMEFEDERRKQRKAYKIVQAKLKLKEEREMAEFRSIEAVQLKKIENRVKNLPKSMQKETLNARKSQLKRERREEEQRFIQRLKRKIDLIMRKFDLNVKLFKIKWEMLEAQLDCAQHEEKREFEKKKNQKLDQLYETQKSGDNFSLFDDSDEETIVENDYATLSQRSLNTWRL